MDRWHKKIRTRKEKINVWEDGQWRKDRERRRNKISRKCNKHDLTIMNTMFTPKKAEIRNLETRSSPDGGIRRQLDYIIINESCKNWIKSVKMK